MIKFFNGIPINIVNTVPMESNDKIVFNNKTYDGFYISFNPSSMDYGCPTTALVIGQGQGFFILEGNHTRQYRDIFDKGFDTCYDYFINNENKSKFSDTPESIEKYEAKMKAITIANDKKND